MILLNPVILVTLIPLFMLYSYYKQRYTKRHKLLYISIIFMIIALARPASLQKPQTQEINTQEFIIALDISYSMQGDDIKPTRYKFAKQLIKKLLAHHQQTRFELFVFSSNPLLLMPPTTHTQLLYNALDAFKTKNVLSHATNITALLHTIAALPQNHKNLLLFSDADIHEDLQNCYKIIQQGGITLTFIQTATHKGSLLYKNGALVKDKQGNIVISRPNSALRHIVESNHYIDASNGDPLGQLDQLLWQHAKDLTTQQKSLTYKEYFFIPLLIAIALFLLGVTRHEKLLQKFLPLGLLLSTYIPLHADTPLQYYYEYKAFKAYKMHHYKEATYYFLRLEPSVIHYYNGANSLYKAHQYDKALQLYGMIHTRNKELKYKILHNMGNCAFKLKHYKQAQQFYITALAFKDDADTRHNLHLLYKHHLIDSKKPQLPTTQSTTKQTHHIATLQQKEKETTTQSDTKGKTNAPFDPMQSTVAQTQQKKKKTTQSLQHANNYQLGYKAYELINKGYTNETQPW